MIDLRSDTVTKPTPAMRRAMAEAEVGDDVYGEDPTVNRLQERAAEIFEKEAALSIRASASKRFLPERTPSIFLFTLTVRVSSTRAQHSMSRSPHSHVPLIP